VGICSYHALVHWLGRGPEDEARGRIEPYITKNVCTYSRKIPVILVTF